MFLTLILMTLRFSILITVLVSLLAIGFIVWFAHRTPRNLKGYYVVPVLLMIVLLAAFVIALAWS